MYPLLELVNLKKSMRKKHSHDVFSFVRRKTREGRDQRLSSLYCVLIVFPDVPYILEWSDRPVWCDDREKSFLCALEWVRPSSHFFSARDAGGQQLFRSRGFRESSIMQSLKIPVQGKTPRSRERERENVMHHAHAGANYFSSPAALLAPLSLSRSLTHVSIRFIFYMCVWWWALCGDEPLSANKLVNLWVLWNHASRHHCIRERQ